LTGRIVHITGASGSGTTTLGRALAERLGWMHLDTDDFYWLPTDPPYREKRPAETRLACCIYKNPHSQRGKTSTGRDTFHGRFIELVPCEEIVEVIEFESPDPRFAGEMKITTSLADTDDGTAITLLCQDVPAGIRLEDNEMGCGSSLQNLAALVE